MGLNMPCSCEDTTSFIFLNYSVIVFQTQTHAIRCSHALRREYPLGLRIICDLLHLHLLATHIPSLILL